MELSKLLIILTLYAGDLNLHIRERERDIYQQDKSLDIIVDPNGQQARPPFIDVTMCMPRIE